MKPVRIGIIGMGNIGKHHAEYLLNHKVLNCQLTAVCSTSPQKLKPYGERGLKIFGSSEELMRSGMIDGLIIATPHYQHTTLGIQALENGLHVMVEKPISAHKADAERLIAASRRHPDLVFAGMFQLRTEPRYLKIRKILTSGELGDFVRCSWIITDWYRTEAYYSSGGWRATWKGEGGGVLLNQCLHNLDTLQWLCGMPARVRAFCKIGRFHEIEVEDDVTAYLEFPNGATGTFITSTGEAPGTNRLEIVGTLGKLLLEENRLTFTRNEVSMTEFSKRSSSGFAKPEVWNIQIPFENAAAPHASLMQNFVDVILEGGNLIAAGEDGIHSVELANSMLYSSLINQTVDIPLNAAAYEQKLQELIANSRFQKKVQEINTDDFAKSFHR
jgi:predicted dehydrogenase